MNVWFGRIDTKDKYYKRIKNVQTAEKVCQILSAFDLNHNSSSGLENNHARGKCLSGDVEEKKC